jgi:multiple sugar transport system substrate-binding protein
LRCIILFFIVFNLLFSQQSKAEEVLKIGIPGTNGVAREMAYILAADFEKKNPNVKIEFIVKEGESYKKGLQSMLAKDAGYDVAFGMAGERFHKYVRLDLVEPITDIWQSQQFDNDFSDNLNKAITFNQKIYAIPFSRYQWGMLYNKNLFAKLSLIPPKNWLQFIDILTTLKNKQIKPIFAGTKHSWAVSAWFEFLNLRINGYDFHQSFINGTTSVDSPQIRLVFKYWKQLIESGFFVEQRKADIRETLPYLYRERAGVILSGSFYTTYVPKNMLNNIGFFSFPQINSNIENVEISPVDIAFIAKRSKNKALAKRFLIFLATANAQEKYNSGSHFLPANKFASVPKKGILKSVQKSLNQVRLQTLFFDREAEENFAKQNMDIWSDFLKNIDIDKAIKKMEEARLNLLSRSCLSDCNID